MVDVADRKKPALRNLQCHLLAYRRYTVPYNRRNLHLPRSGGGNRQNRIPAPIRNVFARAPPTDNLAVEPLPIATTETSYTEKPGATTLHSLLPRHHHTRTRIRYTTIPPKPLPKTHTSEKRTTDGGHKTHILNTMNFPGLGGLGGAGAGAGGVPRMPSVGGNAGAPAPPGFDPNDPNVKWVCLPALAFPSPGAWFLCVVLGTRVLLTAVCAWGGIVAL